MFPTALLTVAFAATVANSLVVPRATPPPGWATDYLEPYDTYHIRYLALSCQTQHGTPFFDECCHPLLAGESLSSRPAECTPSTAASASASSAAPTSTVVPDDSGDDSDCSDTTTTADSSSTPAPVADAGADPADAGSDDSTPTTTSHTAEHTTTSQAPQASSGSSSAPITGGFGTFFFQNGVAGACGIVHKDSDFIAAIDADRYGNTGEVSPLCGKQIQVTNTDNGKSVTVTIEDACPTCDNSNSVDLSQAAFDSIASESTGIVPISYVFL